MDNLNLGSNESVIHTTQRLIINGVSHEAVLTDSRVILVDSDSGNPQVDIPFAGIEHAIAETNRLREPVIRITYSTPDGSTQGIELIFIFLAAGLNVQNRDKCMTVFKDQGVQVRMDPYHADSRLRNKKESMDAGTLDGEQPLGRPAVPEWTIYGISQTSKNPLPEEPPPRSPLFTIVAVILIAAIVIGAMTMPLPEPRQPKYLSPQTTMKPTAVTTPVPTPVATPRPMATPTPEITLTPSGVPANGFWVKISYPGNYAGFLAAGGLRVEVNSSGTQYYQLPVQDTVIDGFIEKADGSSNMLEMGVYNGGMLIASQNTTTPGGITEMHVAVGPAILSSAVPNPTTVPLTSVAAPAPEATPARFRIPATGVWVHVVYPGDFSGFLSFNGRLKEVNSSGEQFYQIPITSGFIDGSIEKTDRSTNTLAVEIYKDGTVLDLVNTSTPKGIVNIHTTV